ncbi:MAG: hypothetical protein M0P55_03950 [Clostridiales bacterium]|nr:hypothetical protein [Clostridiales bacterium]
MDYDLVILDASGAALGFAEALQGQYRVLVLNRTAMVAAEFINAFRPCPGRVTADSPPARSILSGLEQEGFLAFDQVRHYSAGPLLYHAFSQLTCDQLYETDLLAVEPVPGGYALDIVNRSGMRKIKTRVLVDTREPALPNHRTLNAILVSRDPAAPPPPDNDAMTFFCETDPNPPTCILQLGCTRGETLFAARHRLIESWQQIAMQHPAWRIAAIALAFAVIPDASAPGSIEHPTGLILLPSAAFPNLLAAIDAGYRLGKELTL